MIIYRLLTGYISYLIFVCLYVRGSGCLGWVFWAVGFCFIFVLCCLGFLLLLFVFGFFGFCLFVLGEEACVWFVIWGGGGGIVAGVFH